MCYYPGQVFPNLNLSLSNKDDYESESPLDGIQYLGLKKNNTKKTISVINVPDNKFLNTEKIKEKISSEGDTITYDLNEIINYQKPDLNTKFKITFVINL